MPAFPSAPADEFSETFIAAWARLRRVKQKRIAQALGVSQQQVCRYLMPRLHKNHSRPSMEISDRLRAWTGGAIHAGNYADTYEPGAEVPPAPPEDDPQAAPADAMVGSAP